MNCFVIISEENKFDVLNNFYALQIIDKQDLHLQSSIDAHKIKQKRPR